MGQHNKATLAECFAWPLQCPQTQSTHPRGQTARLCERADASGVAGASALTIGVAGDQPDSSATTRSLWTVSPTRGSKSNEMVSPTLYHK